MGFSVAAWREERMRVEGISAPKTAAPERPPSSSSLLSESRGISAELPRSDKVSFPVDGHVILLFSVLGNLGKYHFYPKF